MLTLGVGIGGATAVFSVVDAVLLRPLPFGSPDRLVRIFEVTPDGVAFSFSAQNFLDLEADPEHSSTSRHTAKAERRSWRTAASRSASSPCLPALRFQTYWACVRRLGECSARRKIDPRRRNVRSCSATPCGASRFRRRPCNRRTRIVRLDGESFHVTGVMPRGFDFPGGAGAWIPLARRSAARQRRQGTGGHRQARPGATLTGLRGELREFGRGLSETQPASNAGWSAGAMLFDEWLVAPRFRDAVWVLFGAVGLLLLLACANVANLLVAHGSDATGRNAHPCRARRRTRTARPAAVHRVRAAGVAGHRRGRAHGVVEHVAVHALGDGRVPRLETSVIDDTVLDLPASPAS